MSDHPLWPDLPFSAWSESCDTLQLWTQIAGKVRLGLTPMVNDWWNVTLRVNARGLVLPATPTGAAPSTSCSTSSTTTFAS